MRVRVLALFAGVLLANCVVAKKKEKQVLPDAVLRAKTVFVVIQPDAKEPLTEPNANLKAQKAVEEAVMKWGKFRLALDTATADIVISVQKGIGKAMSPTISGGPVDSRPVDVEGDASQIRIEGSGSGSGSGVEKGIRGVGEGRGGTGKTKAATTAGEKLALRSTAKM